MKGFREDWQPKVRARFVGRGRIDGVLYDLGEYPGAIRTDADSGAQIKGELYELGNPKLAVKLLDQYEGFFPDGLQSSLFVRTTAPVTLENGQTKNAWVYVYNRPVNKAKLVCGGDYRDKLAGRKR